MTAEALKRELDRARDTVRRQIDWILQCGGNEAGYVARYGDSSAPDDLPVAEGGRYGMGGQAIYAADRDALRQYVERVESLEIAYWTRTGRHDLVAAVQKAEARS